MDRRASPDPRQRGSATPDRRRSSPRILALAAALAASAIAQPALADAPPIVPPRADAPPEVPYPAGGEGEATVILTITVDKDGSVRSVEASSGAEPFASAARDAARGLHFSPATREGKPIAAKILYEITFHPPKVDPPPPGAKPPGAKPPDPDPHARPGAQVSPAPAAKSTPSASAPIEILVRAEKPPPSVTSMSRAEVRQIPGAFGDPFRAIEALPGVTPIVSGLPYFYVRGAPPGNVGYYFDGVRVPYLFHVAAGPSVINPAMVDRVDLYSGGYPARFGRFAGAIVSADATAPRDDFHGEANLRIFDAGALAETGFAGGRGTALVGGRFSYTGAIFSLISPTVRLDYRDYQARVTYDLTSKDRLTLFAFGAYDLLAEKQADAELIVFGAEFYRFDLRYDRRLDSGGQLRMATTWGYDQTRIGEQRNAQDILFDTRVELTQPIGEKLTARAGIDAQFDTYTADPSHWSDPDNPGTKAFNDLFPPRTDAALAAHADLAWRMDRRVELTPGVRFDLFRSGDASALSADGRLSMRVDVNKNVRILHALGLAHQPPSFIIPLPGLAIGNLRDGLQTSAQASSGVEVEWPDVLTATVTLFDDVFLNMSDTLRAPSLRGLVGADSRSLGSAYGLEVYVRRRLTKRLGGFLSYTLSRSTRKEGRSTFPSAFDRTHVLNAALAVDIAAGWRAGARATVYSGAPTAASQVGALSSDPTRDPAYYQFDLRVEKRWSFAKARWISFVAEMANVTLHKEIIKGTKIGPISIPSIGVEGGL